MGIRMECGYKFIIAFLSGIVKLRDEIITKNRKGQSAAINSADDMTDMDGENSRGEGLIGIVGIRTIDM